MMPPDWRPPILNTPRLTLRPFTEADAETLFPLANNPNVTRFTLWDYHKTVEETIAFVRDYALLRYREGTTEPYAITLVPDPRPIGACGCFWASQPNRTMELGYWVAEAFWGKGIAVEASRACVERAFQDTEARRMQARVIAGNAASCRVLEKLGFRYEGTHREALFRRGNFEDVMIYAVLREEWVKNPAPPRTGEGHPSPTGEGNLG
jgi:[ribosomal protein S5]-alanine N-acetyltransferase